MFCPKCGKENDAQERFCQACGFKLPIISVVEYAGFWRRLAAALVDGIILNISVFVISFIFGIIYGLSTGTAEGAEVIASILSIFIVWLYFAGMESSSKQATLGKMAIGIAVTDLNRERISFGRATGRYFGKIISALILCIGYLMAGFTEKKQALHDMMAGCLVIKKR